MFVTVVCVVYRSLRNVRELWILGRERLRVRDFLIVQHRACANQRHFGGKKPDTIVIFVRGFAKMLSCQNKSRTRSQFWHFSISKKAHVPTMRINEQPILQTKCKINRQRCKFSKYFR